MSLKITELSEYPVIFLSSSFNFMARVIQHTVMMNRRGEKRKPYGTAKLSSFVPQAAHVLDQTADLRTLPVQTPLLGTNYPKGKLITFNKMWSVKYKISCIQDILVL